MRVAIRRVGPTAIPADYEPPATRALAEVLIDLED